MKYYLSILVLSLFSCLHSQTLNYIHYNTNNSKLPHDAVYQLRQDKNGYIWVCTDDGLVRFDGTEMVNYDKGFVSKYVICTDEERDRIWASTWKGGIHYIKNDSAIPVKVAMRKNATYNAEGTDRYLFSTNGLTVFNDLLIAGCFKTYMVLRFDSTSNTLIPIALEKDNGSKYIVYPGDKEYLNFLKTSTHRLYAYGKRGVFEVVNNKLRLLTADIVPDNVWESPDSILYFQRAGAIYKTNKDFTSTLLIYNIPIEKFDYKLPINFKVLPSGNICLLFETPELLNSGMTYFLINVHSGDITDLSNAVGIGVLPAGIIIDKEGSMWLSTDGRGLYHVFDQKFKQITSDRFLYNSNVTTLHSFSRDSLFIGTKKGLYVYHNKHVNIIKCVDSILNSPVRGLFQTRSGNMGFSVSNLKTKRMEGFVVDNGQVSQLPYDLAFVFKNYRLNLYSSGKIRLSDSQGKKDYTSDINSVIQNPSCLEEDDKGKLWISAGSVLYSFHPDYGLKKYELTELCDLQINCLRNVAGSGLFIGTNQGLFLLPGSGSPKHWGIEDGLTNLNIRCLTSEKAGSLWIGTQNGLFNFKNNTFSIYKKRDGLIADDVTCLALLNGNELAVGSSKGLTVFMTKHETRIAAGYLTIEKFLVNDKKQDHLSTIDVPYNSNIFLKYGLVTFVYPELVVYSYRLNKSEKWITTQNSSLVFTNLKPGNYSLELKAKKYDTDYSEAIIIEFTIHNPWWMSFYFYGLLFLASVLLGVIYLKIQVKKHRERALARYELAELKMKALQAQLNPHFISNALNAIQYFILKQDEVQASNYLAQFTELTRLFLEVSRRGLVTLKMELDLLNNYLSLEKLRFENKLDYSVEVASDIDLMKEYIPGLLVQPFVENSINHGIVYLPKGRLGVLSVKIEKADGFIKIVINDNGIGREKAGEIKRRQSKFHDSHAMQIVEELKQAYNLLPGCEIEIEVFDKGENIKQPVGTCVYIRVKISRELLDTQQF